MESIEYIRRNMAIRLTVAPKHLFKKLASNEAHQDTAGKELAEFLTHNWEGAEIKRKVAQPHSIPGSAHKPDRPAADVSNDDIPW
jgi:hypothetical protein